LLEELASIADGGQPDVEGLETTRSDLSGIPRLGLTRPGRRFRDNGLR
jgi:hypothetical protein